MASKIPQTEWTVDSDTLVVVGTGVLAIAVFVVSAVLVSHSPYVEFGTREMIGLTVGFVLFMLVYFGSLLLHRVIW